MLVLEGRRAARYRLVTAGHRFLLQALPLRHPASRDALASFVQSAGASRMPSADIDAVLLKLLTALEPHTGGRLPSLVDRYLVRNPESPDPLRRFARVVDDVIRFRGIGDPYVQQAIAFIDEAYGAPDFREASLAARVELTPPRLCERFKAQTGRTTLDYLRDVRLDRGGRMLVESNRSIKEISWAVGYKDASNFDHDFKTRFGRTPTEYRALSFRARPNAQSDATARASPADEESHVTDDALPGAARRVLVVDDDPGTRDTLGSRLRRRGYRVTLARSAADALEHAQSTDVEVIVLDVHLPDMDGLVALRELRRRRSHLYPSVVLFTADWEVEDDTEEILALGATVLPKLSDLEEVVRTIASLCAGSALRRRH